MAVKKKYEAPPEASRSAEEEKRQWPHLLIRVPPDLKEEVDYIRLSDQRQRTRTSYIIEAIVEKNKKELSKKL